MPTTSSREARGFIKLSGMIKRGSVWLGPILRARTPGTGAA